MKTNALAITALIVLFASLGDSNETPATPPETPTQTTCKCSDGGSCCQCDETIKALESRIAKLEGMMGGLNDLPVPPDEGEAPAPPKETEGYKVTQGNGYLEWYVDGVRWWIETVPEGTTLSNGLTYQDGYMVPSAPQSQSAKTGHYETRCDGNRCYQVWVED